MTPKQQRFVEEYCVLRNASEAARRAGYAEHHAGAIGSALLRKPTVVAALAAAGVDVVPGVYRPGHQRNVPRKRPQTALTVRQQKFVNEYLLCCNATEAAIRAGLPSRNPSYAGSKMLRRPIVAQAIERERAESAERTRIDRDRVMLEYARIAYAEIGAIADWDDDGFILKPKDQIALNDRAAVMEIAAHRGESGPRARIKMHSKLKALEAIAKHLALWGKGAAVIAAAAEKRTIDGRDPREVFRERIMRLVKARQDPAAQAAAETPPAEKEEKKE